MIIIKKFSSILASLVVLFSVIPAQASTISNSNSDCFFDKEKAKLVYEKEEITDEDKLFHMAIEGTGYLSDSEQQEFSTDAYLVKENTKELSSTNLLTSEKEEETVQLQTYSTSQLLGKYEMNGQIYEEIAVTNIAVVQEDTLNNITAASPDPDTYYDSTYSVKLVSTNYFIDGGKCIDLTAVAGTWTISDKSVSIGTRSVRYGVIGVGCDPNTAVQVNSGDLYPTGNSYSYSAPSSWRAINVNGDYVVGHTARAELVRNSSKWSFVAVNNVGK